MGYTVLARKYRSSTFDEVIGQEPISRTLKNAVATDHVHHGYLFAGTRGVGKTSMARILAKAMNCQSSTTPTTEPCGQCDACRSIAAGEDLDVIEIDAASNTGVDNIRELRSNAQYRPARCRYKIYIIDEVHMLSTGAFNALLKTLEEPPEHVKFVLCTTEPHRVPATIQSRCQRFDFRAIATDKIANHLERVLQGESIPADGELVRRIARLANGSMRDALSILDQLLSLGQERLGAELIDEILPRPNDELLIELVDSLADNDPSAALICVERCVSAGFGLERFAVSLIEHLRGLMVLAVCGADTDLVDLPGGLRERMALQSGKFDAPTYVYMIGVLEELRRNVRFSSCGRALVDAVVVRLADVRRFSSIESLLSRLEGSEEAPRPAKRPDGANAARPSGGATPGRRANGSRSSGSRVRDDTGSPAPSRGGGSEATGPGRPSKGQTEAVLSDPMVQKALEMFEGSLSNVKQSSRGG